MFNRVKGGWIEPCPICGKKPKSRIRINGCAFGGYVRFRCKPLFKKEHLSVEVGHARLEVAYTDAVKEWNRCAKDEKQKV